MAGRYQAYPEYKDSVSDWLGLIPSDWDSIAIGRLFTRVKRTDHVDKELLSVYRDHGVVPKSSRDDNNNKPSDDLAPYQLVQPNDLVLNKMKTWQGSIAISEYEGIVSPAYFVYQPNAELFSKAHPKYIHYLLRNPLYIAQYLRYSKGIRVNQWDLDPDEFKLIELLLPEKDEQIAIANFLDHETAKIDTLIDKQQQLIRLLKEKRQAVISHAVTKGLNPAAPMKDSGVEWLGEVPEHWVVKKISHIALLRSGDGITSEQIEAEGAYPVFGGNGLRGYCEQFNLDGDYVLIGRQGALCGNINYGQGKFWASEHAIVVYPIKKIQLKWLGEMLRAMDLNQYSVSAAQPGLSVSNVTCLKMPFPPQNERSAIESYIDEQTRKIDILVRKALDAITLMQERRTALISAAVTGKIDVRNWQAAG